MVTKPPGTVELMTSLQKEHSSMAGIMWSPRSSDLSQKPVRRSVAWRKVDQIHMGERLGDCVGL
jgi:hypothetical protein